MPAAFLSDKSGETIDRFDSIRDQYQKLDLGNQVKHLEHAVEENEFHN